MYASPKISRTVRHNPTKNVAEMALLRDNPSLSLTKDLSRYITKLDQRLSVPKFTKNSDKGSIYASIDNIQRSTQPSSFYKKGGNIVKSMNAT